MWYESLIIGGMVAVVCRVLFAVAERRSETNVLL